MAKKKKEDQQRPRPLQEVEQENRDLFSQLTNKNSEYMVSLNRRLKDQNVPRDRRVRTFNDMLKEIIDLQEDSITARRHYGTVTECADMIISGKVLGLEDSEEEISPRWMIYLDGALMLGGIFAAIYGLGQLTQKGAETAPFGLTQVIGNYLFGGLAMMILSHYMPKKGTTKGLGKYILMSILVMFSWVFVVNLLLAFLPPVLNPVLPAPMLIAIGIGSIILKMYLKNKWNIQGTIF